MLRQGRSLLSFVVLGCVGCIRPHFLDGSDGPTWEPPKYAVQSVVEGTEPTAFAASGGRVFIVEFNTASSVQLDGSDVQVIGNPGDNKLAMTFNGIVVDDSSVFWGDLGDVNDPNSTPALLSAPRRGGTLQRAVPGIYPAAISMQDDSVWFVDGGGQLHRFSKSAGHDEVITQRPGFLGFFDTRLRPGVVVDGSGAVFWVAPGGKAASSWTIQKLAAGSAAPVTLTSHLDDNEGNGQIVPDEHGNVLYVDMNDGTVKLAGEAGTRVIATPKSGTLGPGLAFDAAADMVYWSTWAPDGTNFNGARVERAPLSGGTAETVVCLDPAAMGSLLVSGNLLFLSGSSLATPQTSLGWIDLTKPLGAGCIK